MTNNPLLIGTHQTIEEQNEESKEFTSSKNFNSVGLNLHKANYNLPNYFSQNQIIDRRKDNRFGDDHPDSTL